MPKIAESPIPAHPGDTACLDLVNSRFTDYVDGGRTYDRLSDPTWLRWFLKRYGLTTSNAEAAPLERLTELRDDLRSVLQRWAERGSLGASTARILDRWISPAVARQRVHAASGSLRLDSEPLASDWTWVVAAIATSGVELIMHGDPDRLKVCGNPCCSWMFYDRTLNGSKHYCSPTPCATLVRVRRHRSTKSSR